jgi:hypothetical protein
LNILLRSWKIAKIWIPISSQKNFEFNSLLESGRLSEPGWCIQNLMALE